MIIYIYKTSKYFCYFNNKNATQSYSYTIHMYKYKVYASLVKLKIMLLKQSFKSYLKDKENRYVTN